MSYNSIWIFFLILQAFATSLPIQNRYGMAVIDNDQKSINTSPEVTKYDDTLDSGKEQIISVRITSSVAVGRGKEKLPYKPMQKSEPEIKHTHSEILSAETATEGAIKELTSDQRPGLVGANIEYIKQLNAKKESKGHTEESYYPSENESNPTETPTNIEEYDEDIRDIPTARKVPSTSKDNRFYTFKDNREFELDNIKVPVEFGLGKNTNSNRSVINETIPQITAQQKNTKEIRDMNAFVSDSDNYQIDDSIAESSIKSIEFAKTAATDTPPTSYYHSSSNGHLKNEQSNSRLTTVSFNIVHDVSKPYNNNDRGESYVPISVTNQHQFYSPKIYSQPSQIYSEPSKFYSEPSKIYSEPSKIYSEPAKVYSEPAKIYSEPAKFYSKPASLHLDHNVPQVPPTSLPNYPTWQRQPPRPVGSSNTVNTTPGSTMTHSYQMSSTQIEHQPERNYEVEENISVITDGRSHSVQESSTEKCKQDNCKVGYVVEGRQYKKYRVEERTSDGFIVGEYGVVRNEDGALRGVRYTADSDASPRLIHDALMKFLQLK
ncbi:unnamed protein product [Arctia plantaginis]|uniref:Uncharacterized protein n=1 Tax=Arctia plantaginis TaxID=874455 RepID=A0A8S0YUI6_ARCPL|nr:unnamed protein product [Arctia plantaginis]CAB3247785.1 unnamed protein product [Arctia plantaginis]